MTRTAIGASLVLVVLAGCGGDGDGSESAARPPRADLVRSCSTHVEGKLPLGWRRDAVIAGPVAFYPARRYASAPSPDPGARFVDQKTLVIVRAGATVTVSVASRDQHRASLDYGFGLERRKRRPPVKLSDGARTVRFLACSRNARPFSPGHRLDRETQFNGGIVTVWRTCLALDVFENGRERPIRAVISAGAGRCPPERTAAQ
jgi:hypothetical protein